MIRVKAGIFSLTPPAPPDDGSYLRWHLLDHLPEQFQLPGIAQAMRYIADGDLLTCAASSTTDGLGAVGGLVNYLVGDPVQQTLTDVPLLGARLAEQGRFPERRASLQLSALALLKWYASPAALVSAEVVPWRPHRGVLLVVEAPADGDVAGWWRWLHVEHYPRLLTVKGTAGAWMYGTTKTWTLSPAYHGDPHWTTVIYLDDDPLTAARALMPMLEQRWEKGAVRPLYAGPLRSMIQWEAWR